MAQLDFFLPNKQSNKPDFFVQGWVAQLTVEQSVLAQPLSQAEPNRPPACTALANPSEATVARLMLRIHFIIPCLLPLGLCRGPSWPCRERGLRWIRKNGIAVDTAVRSTPTALQTHRLVLERTHSSVRAGRRKRFRLVGRDFHIRRDLRFAVSPRSIRLSKYAGCSLESVAPLNRIMQGWWKVSAGPRKPLEHLKSGFSKIVTSIIRPTFPIDPPGKVGKTLPGAKLL